MLKTKALNYAVSILSLWHDWLIVGTVV